MPLSALPLIQEADLKNKVVLVRVDHNVVKNGVIHDPYRIDATFGTLFYILAKGGKIILMTHVGRPRNKKDGTIVNASKCGIDAYGTAIQSVLSDLVFDVYNLQGHKVRHHVNSLNGLPRGIYIVNGKKIVK